MKKQVPFIGEEFFARDDGRKICDDDDLQLLSELLKPEAKKHIAPASSQQKIRSDRLYTNVNTSTTSPPKANPPKIHWHPINNGQAIRINVHGDLDFQMLESWRQLLRETQDNGIYQFEIDLKESQNISLAGIAMLLWFKEQKRAGKSAISLNQCNRALYKRLVWCGLTDDFIIRPRH